MRSRTARRGMLVVFGAVGIMMLAAAVGWACTWPVGQTEVVSPTDETLTQGDDQDQLVARSEIHHNGDQAEAYGRSTSFFGEHNSPCGDQGSDDDRLDAECLYELGVVNPTKYDEDGLSDTCHYETRQSQDHGDTGPADFAVIDTDPTHTPTESPAVREVVGAGTVPTTDDADDPMGDGATVTCFYSSEAIDEGTHLNGREDGAAAATLPAPVLIVSSDGTL